MKKKGFTLIELIVVICCIAIIVVICMVSVKGCSNSSGTDDGDNSYIRTVVATVTDKGIKEHNGEDTFFVYTNETTFRISDDILEGNFYSSDMYGKIIVGKTYEFTVKGWRNGTFSAYPNIIEMVEVEVENDNERV
jgi:prepilin-type N-terminal cleavage/methylation domain-containing protein